MSGDHRNRAIGEGFEEAPSCRSRRFRVNAEAAIELRLGALQRRVHDIATPDRGCSPRAHHNTDVAGVCPVHGSIHTLSSKAKSVATNSTWRLSMTGSRLFL